MNGTVEIQKLAIRDLLGGNKYEFVYSDFVPVVDKVDECIQDGNEVALEDLFGRLLTFVSTTQKSKWYYGFFFALFSYISKKRKPHYLVELLDSEACRESIKAVSAECFLREYMSYKQTAETPILDEVNEAEFFIKTMNIVELEKTLAIIKTLDPITAKEIFVTLMRIVTHDVTTVSSHFKNILVQLLTVYSTKYKRDARNLLVDVDRVFAKEA